MIQPMADSSDVLRQARAMLAEPSEPGAASTVAAAALFALAALALAFAVLMLPSPWPM
jgi:hypothetical protein